MKPISRSAIGRIISCSLLVALSLAAMAQTAHPAVRAIKIDPPEATVFVGEKRVFTASVNGANAEVIWSIKEPDGGRISDAGTYTAPRAIGIYHVVASSKTDPRAKSVATVTVAVHSDVKPQQ